LQFLEKAKINSSDMRLLESVSREIKNKLSLSENKEKQERIDNLVKELLENMKSGGNKPLSWDNSKPLTLWITDFKTQGYSLCEGEEYLLSAGLADKLIQNDKIKLTERAVLDKLMEELKLGSSRLADKNNALSLGKLISARLILIGNIVYSGSQTQISMRIVETETGQITISINEVGNAIPVSILSDKLSEKLLGRIKEYYFK
jgi:hypothetical protein